MKFECGLEIERRGIDMIPLIDVVFLLLVFFIYAMLSMTVHRAIDVRLPKVGESETVVDDYVAIGIDEENQLFLNNKPVAPDEIVPQLQSRTWVDADTPISIHGDSRSQLGTAVRILDLLRRHGYERVSLSVEQDDDGI